MKYIRNLGDMSPLEEIGLFVFKHRDDYVTIETQNVVDAVGHTEGISSVSNDNEEAVWIEENFFTPNWLNKHARDILKESGWDFTRNDSPDIDPETFGPGPDMSQEEYDLVVIQEAIGSGASNPGFAESFVEAAHTILGYDPESEQLQEDLRYYLEPPMSLGEFEEKLSDLHRLIEDVKPVVAHRAGLHPDAIDIGYEEIGEVGFRVSVGRGFVICLTDEIIDYLEEWDE